MRYTRITWGSNGTAVVGYSLIVTLPKSVLRLRKEFQNMLPLVIDVVPDTNSRKDIYPSVTSAVRPLCSQPDSCNKRFETVYRSTSYRSRSSQMTRFFRHVSYISPASGSAKLRTELHYHSGGAWVYCHQDRGVNVVRKCTNSAEKVEHDLLELEDWGNTPLRNVVK